MVNELLENGGLIGERRAAGRVYQGTCVIPRAADFVGLGRLPAELLHVTLFSSSMSFWKTEMGRISKAKYDEHLR